MQLNFEIKLKKPKTLKQLLCNNHAKLLLVLIQAKTMVSSEEKNCLKKTY